MSSDHVIIPYLHVLFENTILTSTCTSESRMEVKLVWATNPTEFTERQKQHALDEGRAGSTFGGCPSGPELRTVTPTNPRQDGLSELR